MKTLNKLSYLLILVISFSLISCGGNDENVQEEEQLSSVVMKDFKEKVSAMQLPSTMQNSSNQYAQQANAQFNAVKGLSQGYITLLTIPATATSSSVNDNLQAKSASNSKTYTWTANGVTIKYIISESSDRYTFSYTTTYNGTSTKLMDGYQLKNGSYAEAKLYDNNTVVGTLKWWVNGDVAKIEINSDNIKLVLETNTKNKSGFIKVYEYSNLVEEFIWNTDGSGTYKNYNTNETHSW
ncbi:hypothetical protein WH52_04575 [Tenacibaculum holothuriorum]|uniref:Lipoprotein n=1 Tax=Tenacibaculum holothuriorum TaxID=1635173 RepID=A0A1Y2PEL6_9FLAO|nr:hypothetical protein [Tenacibaculum holothuriorum]OSY88944.1 hypothetical protein WH52_04575 [Tenacibaculum holothuriorum]